MSAVKHDMVYVLTQTGTGYVAMATSNDSEAWAMYRDMKNMDMGVWINMNQIAHVPALKQER